jgi:integrase
MAYFRHRGDTWYYTLEYTDDEGKHHKHERRGGTSKATCQQAWRAAMAEIDQSGEFREPTKMTVSEYLEEWIKECVEILPKHNTIKSYKGMVRNHINPAIGSKPLRKITARILQNLLNAKSKEFSASTVSSICAVLKISFSYAKDFCGYIRVDPAAIIKVPNYIDAPKTTEVFSHQQLTSLFAKFPPGHNFYMPMAVSYHTGMREGECFANGWDMVDMDKRIYKVRSTVVTVNGVPTIQPIPKSKSSRRDIPFGEKLYKILKAEKARQAAHKLQYGPYYKQNNLVCCLPDGSLMGYDDIRYFNMFCKEQFAGGSFHSFRHTHATMLLEAGEDLELVSKRLGHSSINITAKTYSHVLEKRISKTIALIDKVL